MATIKVNVKWGKQKFEVDLDTSAPVELLFAHMKKGDLNRDCLPMGKKSKCSFCLTSFIDLATATALIHCKLASIPVCHRVRFWHHTALSLYGYLYFQKN